MRALCSVRRLFVVLAATALVVILLPGHPLVVAAFLTLGPGFAVMSRLKASAPSERATRIVVAIAVSLCAAELLSTAIAIAHVWSARWLLGALAAGTVLAYRLPDGETR